MSPLDKYEVFMKMLQIIEQDQVIAAGTVSPERVTQITNFIQRLEGNIVQQQVEREEVVVMEGDRFENVTQSIIATRGSVAKGVIAIRGRHGDEVAEAFKSVEAALTGEPGNDLSAEHRREALELLAGLTEQGAKPDTSKPVLRSLGKTFWDLIEKVEPLSKACLGAWKVIEKIWM
jgi:hypothetical protein